MSKPHNYFTNSLERALALLDLAESQEEPNDDLSRSAAVLSVAAYDHYFTSKFCDVLAGYLRKAKPNKELLEQLSRAGLNTEAALEIAVMKRPFRRIRSLLTSALSEKTTNRTKSIDNLFSGIDLNGLSGRVTKKIGKSSVPKSIDKLVDMRNDIVHSAHINSHGKPKAVDGSKIRMRVQHVALFVNTSEDIINDWVKSSAIASVSSST
ncbi:HEPN domain-containing protein [Sulfitobacter sp. HNIBRBA2951]|uniref:HEPN domain-containing protein n=1 Tax=Sulfitobacter aquimarinus TaxID=3158557 RepID=UPI0032DFA846